MNQNKLDEILRLHELWLKNDPEGQQAALRNANLYDADLREANLRNAVLQNADLCYAGLRNADLRNADLREANLRYADLWIANLQKANLWNADLRGVTIHPDNPCVLYKSENITILDTGLYDFYVFDNVLSTGVSKQSIPKELKKFKELITVLSMNS